MSNDLYQILGIHRQATQEEIKRAYRKLVFKYHPDKNKNPDASEMFKKIQIAYETLSNVDTKAMYDNFMWYQKDRFCRTTVCDIFMWYQETVIELCEKYSVSKSDQTEIIKLFDPSDFETELQNNDLPTANKKLFDKVLPYLTKTIVEHFKQNYPFIWSSLNFLVEWV
jgi:DnaJ-class molecular chaperone with C-terminal Zn finger domain